MLRKCQFQGNMDHVGENRRENFFKKFVVLVLTICVREFII